MSSTTSGSQGLGTKTARTSLSELESMVSESPTSDRACGKLAQILRVRRSEVALLRLEKGSLKFIYPAELRSAGVLPLSGSAVAARTASTRSPLLSNAFMRVKHASLFEAVKIVSPADENERSMEQMPIQKIMSVPVVVSSVGAYPDQNRPWLGLSSGVSKSTSFYSPMAKSLVPIPIDMQRN